MENKVMLMIDALKDGFNRFADFFDTQETRHLTSILFSCKSKRKFKRLLGQ